MNQASSYPNKTFFHLLFCSIWLFKIWD